MDYKLIQGDCLEVMKGMEGDSVDAIVTDPPYGLGFMGKEWDHGVPGEAFWAEALRVAKPGAHLLAFGGTRTFHRLMVAIEDAGWEIRDTIGWLYGSGFPKSHNVSKAIDKTAGAEREVVGDNPNHRADSGINYKGVYAGGNTGSATITAPATPEAEKWDGWGTALKPAWEPVVFARKPLIGTVAANVIEYGTGAINIDGCRVETGDKMSFSKAAPFTENGNQGRAWNQTSTPGIEREQSELGRWPANIIHDGSGEVLSIFPVTKNGGKKVSAARFFYCAKASKKDRGEYNKHPTVKPTDLMRHLCRLVTPPGGTILDPFMGSGSTGKAVLLEGFSFVGIELDADSIQTAEVRLADVAREIAEMGAQLYLL